MKFGITSTKRDNAFDIDYPFLKEKITSVHNPLFDKYNDAFDDYYIELEDLEDLVAITRKCREHGAGGLIIIADEQPEIEIYDDWRE